MKFARLSAALAMLGGCYQADDHSSPANAVAQAAPAVTASSQMDASRTTKPDGSALTDEYCFQVEKERANPFDNTKSCLMAACDAGDKASCEWAATYNGNLNTESGAEDAAAVLSVDFRACFGTDSPLNAKSYDCLDREYRRLDALLTKEYRAALARQPDEVTRNHLTKNERRWWRTRFDHCADEVGGLRGSTATVINEECEIDALAKRIAELRQYGR